MRGGFRFFRKLSFQPKVLGLLAGLKFYQFHINNQEVAPQMDLKDNEEELQKDLQKDQKVKALQNLTKYQLCDSQDIPEGTFKSFVIGENNYEIIISRVKGKLHCISATCTYDDKTSLKDGQLFGNKLFCPLHGCAFNVESGTAEYAPAKDNLPIFFVQEKDEKVVLHFPQYPPQKLMPSFTQRDFSDMRKVLIIGSGVAAHACIETLRSHGYSGEITMVSQDTKLPYDTSQLTKQIKNLSYSKLTLRSDEWYEQMDINFMLGRSLHAIYNEHGKPYVILEDGIRIEFDALLCCTGVSEVVRNIPGLYSENMYFLRNIQDHEKLKNKLPDMKKLTILGCSLKSMEFVNTLRREFPDIELLVVDENDESQLQSQLGEQISDFFVRQYAKKGVKFLFKDKIREFLPDEEQNIKRIQFEDGMELDTDGVLCFPNNFQANTDFLDRSERTEEIEYDKHARVYTDLHCRSEHKRIFFAGKNSVMNYFFLDNRRIGCDTFTQEYHQGVIVGYNIMGLGIPFHMIPQTYSNQLNTNYLVLNKVPKFDEVHIEGSLEKDDFIAYFSLNNYILGAFASKNRNKEISVMNEAFRLACVPTMEMMKEKTVTIELLEKRLKGFERSGCFKDEIYKVRYDPLERDVLWIMREVQNKFTDFMQGDQSPNENREGQVDD